MAFDLRDEHVATGDVVVKSITANDNDQLTALVNEYLEEVDHQLLDIKWAAANNWLEVLIVMRRHEVGA